MKNLAIFYFSSTGNSLYIAKKTKERFGGSIIYIPSYNGNGSEFEKIIIITPIYSFGLPIPVLEFLGILEKGKEIIIIQNYGGMKGGADRLFLDYATKSGLCVKGMFALKMPENYTLVMSPPTFYKNKILKSADRRIKKVLDDISNSKFKFPKKGKTKEQLYIKNKANWHIIGKRFSVNEKCIKCGKCIQICPAQNIELKNGKIVFKDKCMACLGCFHRCPQKAIIYKNKDNKKRYINPNINENEIGKNIF